MELRRQFANKKYIADDNLHITDDRARNSAIDGFLSIFSLW